MCELKEASATCETAARVTFIPLLLGAPPRLPSRHEPDSTSRQGPSQSQPGCRTGWHGNQADPVRPGKLVGIPGKERDVLSQMGLKQEEGESPGVDML